MAKTKESAKRTSWFRQLFNPIDLTEGSIFKTLLLFLIPILLSLLFQQMYTLTDSIVIGKTLSPEEVSGVNDVGALVNIILQFAVGSTSGFAVVTAHKVGEKNPDGARKSFLVQIYLGLILSALLTVLAVLLVNPLLSTIGIRPDLEDPSSPTQQVYQAAHDYLFVIDLGFVFQMGYNLVLSVLRALGDSFTPFLFLVVGTVANVINDTLFLIVFKWGVIGAAWATNLSQFIAMAGCFVYAFRHYPQLRFRKGDSRFSWSFVLEHLKLGLPLGLQFSILEIGIIIMQAAVISFDYVQAGSLKMVAGTPAQLGYSTACKYYSFFLNLYSALGTGMVTFVGQNYGAKKWDRIRKGVNESLLIGTGFWALSNLIGFLGMINNGYLYLFLKSSSINAEVAKYGNAYLDVALPSGWILMVLFLFRNSLQGLDRPLFPFLAGIGELLARSLLCLYLPSFLNGGPIDHTASLSSYVGVCFADPLAWVAATLIMVFPILHALKKNASAAPSPSRLPRA